ncbi:MAG: hypothetical protein CMJ18_04085 [Phycisphaeraceae bacterium]|nr:hypothetical protein [Phycisphaeraceae bacterium]
MGLLTAAESAELAAVVRDAEARTSAEIRVVITRHCWGDLRAKGQRLFRRHGLDATAGRNAVMILLVAANREVLVYGDNAIHERVGPRFWVEVKDLMVERFSTGDVVGGLREGVLRVGERLVEHFPRADEDVNELDDGVIDER